MRQRLAVLMLAWSITVLFVSGGAITLPSRSFAQSSQPSATPVDLEAFRRACAEAVEELRAAKKYIATLEAEIKVKGEIDTLEAEITAALKNLRSLDAQEIAALKTALAAKDRVIAAYEAEIVVLKRQRMTFWKKAKWFVYGGLAGAAVCAVACRR